MTPPFAKVEPPPKGPMVQRYVPRAINGGPAWRVFDRKRGVMLTDAELEALPMHQIDETVPLFDCKDVN